MRHDRVTSGGPFEPILGYSRAVRRGNIVCVSGTTALKADYSVDSTDAYDQAVTALDIIRRALADLGADMQDVVRTRIYVTNHDDIEKVTKAHGEAFGAIRPACSMITVVGFMIPELVVEIEADAITEKD